MHLELGPADGADLRLDVVAGTPTEPATAPSRHALVAVRSDWTDPCGLVGFFNPLTNSYVRTTVVDLLLRAAEDPGRPYFVILDEMNLARVEYYPSDFLSALESDEPIELMTPGVEEELLALSLGFIWAGITRTPGGANTLDLFGLIPLLYLAGGLFPRDAYSHVVQQITDYAIPFAPMFDMLRGIALEGVSIADYGRELLVGAAWVAALFVIATRVYRLKED